MEKFEKREAHPMEKYIGRLVNFYGSELEVVGYSRNEPTGEPLLIVEALPFWGLDGFSPGRRDIQRMRKLLVCQY